jgi:hypothetical protein
MATCSSCKKQFKNNQGLTKHQHTCKSLKLNVTHLLQKRSDLEVRDSERREAAKIARRAGKDVGEERSSLAKSCQDVDASQSDEPSENVDGQEGQGFQAVSLPFDQMYCVVKLSCLKQKIHLEPELHSTTSGRRRKFPKRFQDYLPSLSTQVPHMPAPVSRHHQTSSCANGSPHRELELPTRDVQGY